MTNGVGALSLCHGIAAINIGRRPRRFRSYHRWPSSGGFPTERCNVCGSACKLATETRNCAPPSAAPRRSACIPRVNETTPLPRGGCHRYIAARLIPRLIHSLITRIPRNRSPFRVIDRSSAPFLPTTPPNSRQSSPSPFATLLDYALIFGYFVVEAVYCPAIDELRITRFDTDRLD